MQNVLVTLRVVLSLAFLFYASWSDYKIREVSNSLWILFAPPAFTFTFMELFLSDSSQLLSYGICFGLTSAFAIILFYSGGFGGADAKALMCLALALPFYPQNIFKPMFGDISPISSLFFPLTVFSNSVLLAAATAVHILLYNIFWHKRTKQKLFEQFKSEPVGKKMLVLITSYKMPLHRLKEKWHLYPMEDFEEDEKGFRRKLVVIPKDEERDAILERLSKAAQAGKIQDMVWATPGLPMLIFITAGLITSLIIGDIVWIIITSILG